MKKYGWQALLAFSLIALSAIFYGIHYLIFHDPHHLFIYMLGDVAFVPIEVLLVTVIIHQLLTIREKRSKLNKLNMVIGTFFSEVGGDLLRTFSDADSNVSDIQSQLDVTASWTSGKFAKASSLLNKHAYSAKLSDDQLTELRAFLILKRPFLLSLLENPTLLEHDAFTDCLWAVFHLTEELTLRKDIASLPEKDRNHINGDVKRAYKNTSSQWLAYMQHLKTAYPYLFSLAMRTNPFDPNASAVVN